MRSLLKMLLLGSLVLMATSPAFAQFSPMSERVFGKASAPVKVDEFVSLTCSHCAEFYTTILPKLEKDYIDTGKVKFVIHDYPLDGLSLKAAALARCMPYDEYVPFIKTLYATQMNWAFSSDGKPEDKLIQTAKLGGLPEDQAKTCLADTKLQDFITTERTYASEKYKIQATPTFILNDGAVTIQGAQSAETFAAAFDKLLAKK